MILHEAVTEVVDGIVIDGEEIPRLVLDEPRRGRVDGRALGDGFAERRKAPVFILIHLFEGGHEGLEHGPDEFLGMQAQFGQGVVKLGRIHGIGEQGPAFDALIGQGPGGAVVMVGNHDAVDRFRGMAGPPADHGAAQAILVEDIPHGLRGAGEVGDGANASAIGRGFGEAVDAVFEGAFPGGDRCPEHR